jgi:hypothetical protein
VVEDPRVRPSNPNEYRSDGCHHVGRSSCKPTLIDPVTGLFVPMADPCTCAPVLTIGTPVKVCCSFRCVSKALLEALSPEHDGTLLIDDVIHHWKTSGVVFRISECDQGDPFRWSNICSHNAFWLIY